MGGKISTQTLFIKAVKSGDLQSLQTLVNAEEKLDIDHLIMKGKTALMIATQAGLYDFVQALLENGSNIGIKHAPTGNTALHMAVQGKHERILQLLLDWGADIYEMNNGQQSVIDLARMHNSVGMVRSLEKKLALCSLWVEVKGGLTWKRRWSVILPVKEESVRCHTELALYKSQSDAKPQQVFSLQNAAIALTTRPTKKHDTCISLTMPASTRKKPILLYPNERDFISLRDALSFKGLLPVVMSTPQRPAPTAQQFNAMTRPSAPSPIKVPAEGKPNDSGEDHRVSKNPFGDDGEDAVNKDEMSSGVSEAEARAAHMKLLDLERSHSVMTMSDVMKRKQNNEGSKSEAMITKTQIEDHDQIEEEKHVENKTSVSEGDVDVDDSGCCNICFDSPKNAVIIPCGHLAGCFECLEAVAKSQTSKCPACRGDVEKVMRVFNV
eukprot:TRINITY_DN779951_c0_g1_i1.p1 TRINITY_DN779951_c0_g1~~TRINITY_DN779951_c0_g1_i1.p1  ORF type:complete len:439 (-),score=124.21 TRINITY_DN779951_c0_g1_i1:356-1672(-)